MIRRLARLAPLLLLLGAAPTRPPEWTRPAAPFHIAGNIGATNIWYVGTEGLAAYLITTPGGAILLDGTLAQNVPLIEANIAKLGMPLGSIKFLLNSHAHYDHAAGLARLKADTGAVMLASAGDRGALETGHPPSDTDYGPIAFAPVKVDRIIRDGEPIRLGDATLTPILTPGHTPGCTTWTMAVTDHARRLRVVFLCSLSVAGNILVGNRGYPGIAGDFARSFARLRDLQADIVLPAHPEFVDLMARENRARMGDATAFMMPGVLAGLVAAAAHDFAAERAKQTK